MKYTELKKLVELVNENPYDFVLNIHFRDGKRNIILNARRKPIELLTLQDLDFIKINRGYTSVNNIADASIIPAYKYESVIE